MSDSTKTLTFPNVSGSNLEGRRFSLPKDFEDSMNIVLIAFRREHTIPIEGWTRSLDRSIPFAEDFDFLFASRVTKSELLYYAI